MTADFEMLPVTIPASVDADDAGLFVRMTAVRNDVYREIHASDNETIDASGILANWQDPHQRVLLYLIHVDGTDVGRASLQMDLEVGDRTIYMTVELLKAVHRRGIGTAIADRLEATALEWGRPVIGTSSVHSPGGSRVLPAPTGFGGVPEDDAAARFLVGRGYRLKQVDRLSEFPLIGTEEVAAEHLAESLRRAGDDYRVVSWVGPTPEDRLDDIALLNNRMSTDAPWGDLEWTEQTWTAERVRDMDARYAGTGLIRSTTAAEHIPTGRVVAFNELSIAPTSTTGVTHQENTLVLKEHRGHRLGMLVKAANIVAWRALVPTAVKIVTENAEENRPMLDVNETLGFVPVHYVGQWQKTVE